MAMTSDERRSLMSAVNADKVQSKLAAYGEAYGEMLLALERVLEYAAQPWPNREHQLELIRSAAEKALGVAKAVKP